MTTDEVLKELLEPLLPGCVAPVEYTGESLEYITWNHSMIPALHAEGIPHAARYLIQVHYFCPKGKNPNPKKLMICRALGMGERFTWPNITDANDADGQHYVFECEYFNGGPAYGDT